MSHESRTDFRLGVFPKRILPQSAGQPFLRLLYGGQAFLNTVFGPQTPEPHNRVRAAVAMNSPQELRKIIE